MEKALHFSTADEEVTQPLPSPRSNKMGPMATYLMVLIGGAISMMAASIGGVMMSSGVVFAENVKDMVQILNVMDDTKLRMVCICGSVGGALLSIGIFPSRRPRLMVIKFFCSGISGMMFSPWLGGKFGVPNETDAMLGWSGFVALCSYTVIQRVVMPLVEKGARKWLGLELGFVAEQKEESDVTQDSP